MKRNIAGCLAAAFLLSMLLAVKAIAGGPDQGEPRVIEIIADRDNTFKVPGQRKAIITLTPGEKIVLRITAHAGSEKGRDNSVHGFTIKKLRDLGWDFRLKEGTQDYALVAPSMPGEYVAECTVKCGRGHDDMTMKVVIK